MKLLNRKQIYKGYCFDLFEDQVVWVNGKQLDRVLIQHPGISVMLPILDSDRLMLVNQYRYGAQANLWEIPAGTINVGEDPLHCAQRELEEEIGYKARKWKPMVACYSSPHYSSEMIHAFVAEDLVKTEDDLDDDEVIEVRVFTRDEVQEMIRSGQIVDAKSLVTLLSYFSNIG
ncbi:MAG: NUDIX hydrolase [FCB group bacterium]|nr:NUDIX hydrolase [FCB group bacterium]MBL7029512.1 NUDIX hydrolase [Candidatus Neomarinimicrobiota bacterium]MBL7122949.1 NUDIX hydrolase [Candidatus Neomarinimicrobiota bacterium]